MFLQLRELGRLIRRHPWPHAPSAPQSSGIQQMARRGRSYVAATSTKAENMAVHLPQASASSL